MIADKFSAQKRPLAISLLTTASALSSVVFMPIAGWIAGNYGWRATFQAAGATGLLMSLLFALTIREPARRVTGGIAPPAVALWPAIGALSRNKAYLWILGGASFMGGVLYAIGAWMTMLLVRVHDYSVVEVASRVYPIGGIASAAGIVVTGWAADRLGRRNPRWRLWLPALTSLAFAPVFVIFLLVDLPALWFVSLVFVYALEVAYQGPAYAAVLSLAPERMRAVAISIMVMVTGLVGQIFGPLTVGVFNDMLAAEYGDMAIRYSLLIVPFCAAMAALCFYFASSSSKD